MQKSVPSVLILSPEMPAETHMGPLSMSAVTWHLLLANSWPIPIPNHHCSQILFPECEREQGEETHSGGIIPKASVRWGRETGWRPSISEDQHGITHRLQLDTRGAHTHSGRSRDPLQKDKPRQRSRPARAPPTPACPPPVLHWSHDAEIWFTSV